MNGERPWLRMAGIAAFILALGLLAWRGPWRAMLDEKAGPSTTAERRSGGGSSDFSLIWQQSRAFLEGKTPYTVESIDEVWTRKSGTPEGTLPPSERNAALLVYPPSTFVLLAPWAWTDWPTARVLWTASNTVLLLAATVLALGMAGLRPKDAAWWFGAAAALAMAPGHATISVGQVSILTFFLIALGQALRMAGRENAAGVALGLATALKPQVGLLFLAYEVGRKRWRVGVMGVIAGVLTLAAGSWWLSRAGVDWLPQWRANLDTFANSDNANPTRANPLAFQLINLHYLVHAMTESVALVKMVVYAVCGGLCLAYFAVDLKGGGAKGERSGEMLSIGFVSVISLLVVYHRVYDAVVLIPVIAWVASGGGSSRSRGLAWIVAGLLLAFAGPWAGALHTLAETGRIPERIAKAWWFNAVVLRHAPLALLGIAGALLAARAACVRTDSRA